MSDGPAVEAQGLVRRFGDDAALQEVSFDVAPGELYGVIGPDGAGKTTLFRILVTLLLPDAGSARVLGRDVVKDLWDLRTRIGYMPGRFSLYPDLSVLENLSFFASLFDTTIAEARETIAPIWVQLERFSDRRAGALSGGMKQKLALCCALVHRPEVLFLDEPTTGVDAVSRREFWDLLARLRDDGLPIVVSTPYMDEAIRCDRVSLMQDGRLLVTDRPDAIGRGYPRPLFAVRGPNVLGLARRPAEVPACGGGLAVRRVAALHRRAAGCVARPDRPGAGRPRRGRGSLRGVDEADRREHRGRLHVVHGARRGGMSDHAIDAQALTRRFGSFTAVDAITFHVEPGEVFGFLGANGAGKTTAIRMLIGVLEPTSGRATVAGYDLKTQSEQVRRRIGYMSQKFSLYEDLTVEENITLYGGIYGVSNRDIVTRTGDILTRIGLEHAGKELVREIPLGWKQQLAFCVALLHRPAVVFLDEPTGGVDPITRRRFWELIYEAGAAGTSVLVTTHYLDEAEYCRRISIMVNGAIAAMGTPAEVRRAVGAETLDEVFVKLTRPGTAA